MQPSTLQDFSEAYAALVGGIAKGTAGIKLALALTLAATLGFAAAAVPRRSSLGVSSKHPEPASTAAANDERREPQTESRKPRVDRLGDPLPDEVVARLGSGRMRHSGLHHPPLAFTPDGKSIVTGGTGGLRVWDAATGKLRRRFAFDAAADWCFDLAFRADSIIVASASEDKKIVTVQVLDPASAKVRQKLEMPDRIQSGRAVFSRDGKWLAYGRDRKTVAIYDAATGREHLRIPVKGNWIADLAFAPDGKTIAIGDSMDTIHTHDTTTGKSVRELQRAGTSPSRFAFSTNGRFLASVSNPVNNEAPSGQAHVWDLTTGEERHRLKAPSGRILCVAFSPDNKFLAMGGQHNELVLWDVTTGKEVRRYSAILGVSNLAFSPDGKSLVTRSAGGTIRLRNVATGRVLPGSADPFLDNIQNFRFSADGRRLLGRAVSYITWDSATGREIRRMAEVPDVPWTVILSPDESLLASADQKGTIHLWDAGTHQLVRTLKGHEKRVRLWFSPENRRLISFSADETIRVWDVAKGQELYKFTNQRTRSLAVSPDGRWLAAASDSFPRGREIRLWNLTTGREETRTPPVRSVFVYELAFSPDSRLLVAVGGGIPNEPGEVAVWEVPSGKRWRLLNGHKADVLGVAFSPTGRMLATGDVDGSLLLWEMATGQKRHQFIGHEARIGSLAFSPDSRLLAAASDEAPAYTWDVLGTTTAVPRPLTQGELQHCWTALAGEDASAAFQAIRRLAGAPKQSLPYLREHLKPVPAPDLQRVRQLVKALDGDEFAERQKAVAELEKLADAAASTLWGIMAKEKPSLEVRRTLQQILETQETAPETLRAVRAVEVLEWIATADAVRLLGELAKGTADARLTREAVAAKRRLAR